MRFLLVTFALLAGTPERVIDADTLDLNGVRIRLWGIQAPERREICIQEGRAAFACDEVGRTLLEALARPGLVCEAKDVDRYGRTVALCRADGADVSRELVRAGYALAYRRFSRDYVADEDDAREAGRGWWSCRVTAPERWEKRKGC